MKLKINGKEVKGKKFAYDGCHKIYIIEDLEDEKNHIEYGYNILEIDKLIEAYKNSCELRFISNAKLNVSYVGQFEKAIFELEIENNDIYY